MLEGHPLPLSLIFPHHPGSIAQHPVITPCVHFQDILLAEKKLGMKKREGKNVKLLIRKYNLIEHVLNQMYWLM